MTNDRAAALAHAIACERMVMKILDGPRRARSRGHRRRDGLTRFHQAQDFKRGAYDRDEGPNTGGMGAYTPLSSTPRDCVDEVYERVFVPTVKEMANRSGVPFSGLLYAGLALTKRGVRVIELDARFR